MTSNPRSIRPCSACGFACDAEFLFCPRCGAAHKPAAAEPEADRRQVTLLFADLTGFTSLAERLDPETVRAFQNALFAAMARAVAHFDGFTEKFVGDAVMAVFGAPRAHEDDPVRALQAALEMLRHVDDLNAQWSLRLGRAVTLHIGVHTGPVVAGRGGRGASPAHPALVAVPEQDPAAREVIRTQLDQDPILQLDLDVVLPNLPADMREHLVPVPEFHRESGVAQTLDDGALDLDSLPVVTHRSTSSRLLSTR